MKYEEFRLIYPITIIEAFNLPIKCKWLCKRDIHNWMFKQEYINGVEKIEQTNDIFGKWLKTRIKYRNEIELYMECRVCKKRIKID